MEATEMDQAIRSAGSFGDVICLDSPEGKKDGVPLFSTVSLSVRFFPKNCKSRLTAFHMVCYFPLSPS